MEETRLALEMVLRIHDDHREKGPKNGSFSPQIGPLPGTTVWETPHETPICNLLTAQLLWKRNDPHWRHPIDAPVIVLNFQDFQDDRPENGRKTGHF